MGALKCFWDSHRVNTSTKVHIYLAILVNLLHWGCQTWALTKVLTKKIEVFNMRCFRRILKIKWDDDRKLKIKTFKIKKNSEILIR